jgi:hypothetical protein
MVGSLCGIRVVSYCSSEKVETCVLDQDANMPVLMKSTADLGLDSMRSAFMRLRLSLPATARSCALIDILARCTHAILTDAARSSHGDCN